MLSASTLNVLERAKRGDEPPERVPKSKRLDRITTPTLCGEFKLNGRRVYRNGHYKGELSGMVVHSAIPQGRGRYEWTHGDSFEGQWKTVVRPKTVAAMLEDNVEETEEVPPPENEEQAEVETAPRKSTMTSAMGDELEGQKSTSDAGNEEVPVTPASLSTYSPFYREEYTKPHGRGCYTWSTGECYEGEYKDGKRNGLGKYTWPNGDVYEGQWRKGKMHGKGKYVYGATGDIFEGVYVRNKREGPGVHTVQPVAASEDGTVAAAPGMVFRGTWQENKKEGEFQVTMEDGTEETKTFVAGVDTAAKGGKKK